MHRYYYRCIISTFKLFNPFILSVFSASQSICGRCQTPASEDSWPIPDRQVQQYSWLLRTATAFFKSRLRFSIWFRVRQAVKQTGRLLKPSMADYSFLTHGIMFFLLRFSWHRLNPSLPPNDARGALSLCCASLWAGCFQSMLHSSQCISAFLVCHKNSLYTAWNALQ